LALILTISLTAGQTSVAADSAFPGKEWSRKSPAELGLNPDLVDGVAAALGGRGCVIKSGYVVKEWGSQSERSDWASSAKPVLSTLLMIAIRDGKANGFDQPIADFGWDLLPKDRSMTFRHLASMTGGYARPEAPGAAWAYNDFAIQLYQKTLFDKVFQADPAAIANGPNALGAIELEDGLKFRETNRRMSASVRDFARIAWLWRHRGKWKDQEILTKSLVDDLMRPQVPKDLPGSSDAETNDYLKIGSYGGGSNHFTEHGPGIYGGNWWFNATGPSHSETPAWPAAPADTFMSLGVRGNCSAIIPSLDLVVVGANADWGPLEAGKPDSVLNQRLRLIVAAGTPMDAVKTSETGSPAATPQPAENNEKFALTGPRQQFQPLTLSFNGAGSSESAEPNPFRDCRLDVTFTQGERNIVVPGYFAADGNAAESGATEGAVWRAHFVPESAGEWTWSVSFRQGTNVAVAEAPTGEKGELDGLSGKFTVAADSTVGTRSLGFLRHQEGHYPKFSGSGEIFLKSGADSPENFLAYEGFDDTKPTHRYLPHLLDYREGDPTWRSGKGRAIIGALNYLAAKGVNSVYFLTMNFRGDGKDVWPWTSDSERFRFDCSKLDQWEIVFRHMDRLGIMLHVVLQEQENDQLLDKGELGPERRLYFRELVARFGHHPALVWNLGEENTNTDQERKSFATYLRAIDPYDHPIVLHTFPGQYNAAYNPLLGFADLNGPSLQTNATYTQTLRWFERSEAAGLPWFVSLDEIGPADTGAKPDFEDFQHNELRTAHLWPHFMAGGAGVEWLFGYKFAHNDINLEDFRSRDHLWELTRIAREFFELHVNCERMLPADVLLTAGKGHCFAEPGERYVIYAPTGESISLDLGELAQDFDVQWFDPRRGGKLKGGEVKSVSGPGIVSLGKSPDKKPGRDWVALVTRSKETTSQEISAVSLTVDGGIRSGTYRAGAAVPVSAPLPPSGQEFDRWEAEGVKVHDVRAARTRVTLSNENGTIRAKFRPTAPTPPVTGVMLINTDTNEPVAGFNPVPAEAVINIQKIGTKNLSLCAEVNGEVDGVHFQIDGAKQQSDWGRPYSPRGERAGKFRPLLHFGPGEHTLSATTVSKEGNLGVTYEIRFKIIDDER
ncbi:MAG: DUF5060 domain-containing protein, partial [Planctomycetaceae bacterium]